MHPTPPLSALAAVVLTWFGAAATCSAQENAEAPILEVAWKPGFLFSAEELEQARAVAVERQERRESYIRATADDDVIVLEPYIVEGDSSLLMARLRRDLERDYGARRRRMEIAAVHRAEMQMQRRAQEAFFGSPDPTSTFRVERRPGGMDAPSMLFFNPGSLGDLVRSGRIQDIFSAPPGAE